jgi:hypothetical protein
MRKAMAGASLFAILLSGCTGGRAQPGPFPTTSGAATITPGPESVAAVCADVADIARDVSPIMTRLRSGTETKRMFQDDVLTVDLLATRLYDDVSDFATSDPHVFEVMNNLSGRLSDVITGEDELDDPADVVPATVTVAQDTIAGAMRALDEGLLPCPTGG